MQRVENGVDRERGVRGVRGGAKALVRFMNTTMRQDNRCSEKGREM